MFDLFDYLDWVIGGVFFFGYEFYVVDSLSKNVEYCYYNYDVLVGLCFICLKYQLNVGMFF